MDKHHKHHDHAHSGGGFSNGFLLGSLIGGGLVFLLGTKKGKEVLKTLTENGFEGVSELKDLLNEEEDSIANEFMQDGEVVPQDTKTDTINQEIPKAARSIKRFFRGI